MGIYKLKSSSKSYQFEVLTIKQFINCRGGAKTYIMYNPKLFARLNDVTRRGINDFCNEFSEELGKMSGRCLDIGSGPADGTVDFAFPKLDPKSTLVCSDISEPMVNFGKEKYANIPRLSFMKLDIESPDLPKDLVHQFDNITSFYCFHMCHDLRKVFKNVFTLLRPGGSTLAAFISRHPVFNAYTKLATMPRYQPYMKDADRYIPDFTHAERPRESLKALLEKAGFDVRHCSLRERSHVFETPEIFRDFHLAVNPFTERIPLNLREEFANDLATEGTKEGIVFNKNKENENDYSILIRKQVFLIYLTKPLAQ